MPTSGQIRGMLLEEALLFLLRKSGYKTVVAVDRHDKTLSKTVQGCTRRVLPSSYFGNKRFY